MAHRWVEIGDSFIFTASCQQGTTEELRPQLAGASARAVVFSGILFWKSRSGSASPDARGSRSRALLDALPHSEQEETWREQRLSSSSFQRFIPRRLAFPPTPALVACCWTKLEFSSRVINTMWPCRGSDLQSDLVEYLIDPGKRDLRMGKLQSKHGRTTANISLKHTPIDKPIAHWTFFYCTTQTRERNIYVYVCVLHLCSWWNRSVQAQRESRR